MFKLFSRAMTRAVKRAASANARATNKTLKKLTGPKPKPARRKRPAALKSVGAAPAKPKIKRAKAEAVPRRALSETVRWIEAGGMPAHSPVTRSGPKVPRGASFKLARHVGDHGERGYKIYVPARSKAEPQPCAPMPVVVMLHGCGQSPDDFAAGTQMNALAEELGFLVVYPSQPVSANASKCWNWYKPGDQHRDAGEPSLIAGITRAVLRDHPADPARVYVAGLSAGGSAAAILAAAYPDLFAAVGVHSGLPAGAAHNPAAGLLAMRQGAPGDLPATAVPTIVFHGDADTVVHPRNGRFVMARALSSHPRLRKVVRNGRSPGGRDYSRTVHRAANGKSCCEHWAVEGAGHAWAGGHPSGSYTDPAGPDASREMLRFFLRHRLTLRQRKRLQAVTNPLFPGRP